MIDLNSEMYDWWLVNLEGQFVAAFQYHNHAVRYAEDNYADRCYDIISVASGCGEYPAPVDRCYELRSKPMKMESGK